MPLSLGKRITLAASLLVLATAASVGYLSHRSLEGALLNSAQKDTLDSASLLSARVRGELRQLTDLGRILASAALQEHVDPRRFLETHFPLDESLIALSVYQRLDDMKSKWAPLFRLTRPAGDPAFLAERDFHELDLRYAFDQEPILEGAIQAVAAELQDGIPLLRLAVPLGPTRFVALEIKQERISAIFAEAPSRFSYLLDKHGRVLAQASPRHFAHGEDLSHLPIFKLARAPHLASGSQEYSEVPGGTPQYGSFHKVGLGDLVVVSQTSRTRLTRQLAEHARHGLAAGLACLLLASAFIFFYHRRIVGGRLARLGASLERLRSGKGALPEKDAPDEIGELARKLLLALESMEKRPLSGGAHLAKGKKTKSKLARLPDQRVDAVVVCGQLQGVSELAGKADPEQLLPLLRAFDTAASTALEIHQGVADQLLGGRIVAFWNLATSSGKAGKTNKKSGDQALNFTLELREATQALNQELENLGLPAVQLALGVHAGTVLTAQVGADANPEHTALGESLELATRIAAFAPTFSADVLVTAQAMALIPPWFSTDQLTPGDENTPELHELIGKAATTSAQNDAA